MHQRDLTLGWQKRGKEGIILSEERCGAARMVVCMQTAEIGRL